MKGSRFTPVAHCALMFAVTGAFAADTAPASAPAPASAAAPASNATAYKIKLDRPSAKGDTYDVRHELTITGTAIMTMDGEPPDNDNHNLKAVLEASCVVNEVDKRGQEMGVTLTIKKFTTGDGKIEMPAGKVIEVKRGEKEAKFTPPEGLALSEDADEVLHAIFQPVIANVSDDDLIDTKNPHKVGERWPINADIMAKEALSHDMQVDAKNVTGTSVIKAVDKVNGTEAIRLVTDMKVTGGRPKDIPDDIAISQSELTFHLETVLPTDEKQQPLETTQTMEVHMKMVMPTEHITQEITERMSDHATVTPSKK
jgi:hypothetical protein